MKNPLPATLWFLHHDANSGLLEDNGFVLQLHLSSGQKVFNRDGFFLYSQGFWLESADSVLVYRNPSRSFYKLPPGRNPLSIPGSGEQRLTLEEGFRSVEKPLRSHEEFVSRSKGKAYRANLIQRMPRSEQRYAKNWKVVFACECRGSSKVTAKV